MITREALPAGWATEYLGNLNVQIFDGPFGSHLKTSDYADSGVRVIRLENIGHGHFIDEKRSFVSEEKYNDIRKHTVVPGDIVFSSFVTESIRSTLVPPYIPFAVNKADCFGIRFCGKATNAKYVHFFLQSRSAFKQIEGMIHGVGRPRINTSQLKELVVPIAPAREQGRIIAKIEELFSELDKGIEALTTARAQLVAYSQAIRKTVFEGNLTSDFRETQKNRETVDRLLANIEREREARQTRVVGGRRNRSLQRRVDPTDPSLAPKIPASWQLVQLGRLNVDIFDGPFGSHLKTRDYVQDGVRVIRLENIGRGRFLDEKRSFVSEKKYAEIEKHTVLPGDIVFSSFVTDGVRSAIVPKSIPMAVNKADCFAVRFFGNFVHGKFVQLFLESRNPFKQLENMVHGVGRPRINTSQLKSILVPICSTSEQEVIIERLERLANDVEALEGELDVRMMQAMSLRKAILEKAFAGQLVAQDSKEEAASALLERIRSERAGATAKRERTVKNGRKRAA